MLVANYRPEKPRDPFIWIVISILLASVLTVYPLAYDLSAWRPFIMLLVMLLGIVSADMVWRMVCIWFGDFYRPFARCTTWAKCADLCRHYFCGTLFYS